MNNMKFIGYGMRNYHDSRRTFPASADLRGDEKKKTAGGWSFLLKIMPNMEYQEPFSAINPSDIKSKTIDPLTDNGTAGWSASPNAIAYIRDISIPELICPSNPNQIFEFPQTPPTLIGKKHAFTNYKAMGATSIESLLLSLDPDSPPPYGDKEQHPDGVLFPGTIGIKFDDIKDGLAQTIMIVETIDNSKSTWIAGCDVNLVGMNKAPSYSQYKDQNANYWAPLDFNGTFYGQATPAIQALRTFTAYDFCPGSKDAGTYPAGVGRTPAYGPSSAHSGIVNHLFCDGSVRSLRKDIDYVAYFFLITRDNGETVTVSDHE